MLTERRSSFELKPSSSLSKSNNNDDYHSTAVVKYSSLSDPTPLSKLAKQTNLNRPPSNWLKDNPSSKGFVNSPPLHSGFTSFRMANDFVDCLADVDVVSDGENIKKLLKIPYTKAPVSMVVHRVGRSLLLDDFDIHKYLLRRSASEWEWIREFFHQIILPKIEKTENAIVRKDGSSSALQERNLVSKFLYRTLQTSLDNDVKADEDNKLDVTSLSLSNLPQLPEPELDKIDKVKVELDKLDKLDMVPNFSDTEKFVRNYLWTFEDIRMLIGSNMPIFGDSEHPCVSLRLRDMKKPINILTGLDYWLDNLMCQVPEVVMCYHLDGLVQKYELLKTEELPTLEGSNFSPKIVKNIAQNILAFLKSNAAKEGHTYWLFKAKDDDIVKLYDLTSLSQKDTGINPKNYKKEETTNDNPDEVSDKQTEENPFQTPVSMLLYRLARNILESEDRETEEGTVRDLLTQCVTLLDSDKYPHIATSAHFLLSELYLPDGTDPSKPSFSEQYQPSEATNDNSVDEDEEVHSDAEEFAQYNVDISRLCKSGSINFPRERKPPRITDTAESRCNTALKHIDQGLQYLSSLELKNKLKDAQIEKERERVERDNIKMSVPNDPIPMGYSTSQTDGKIVMKRTRSVSEGSALLEKANRNKKEITWTEYLKFLLLKKALLVYVTMAELYFNLKHLGRTLKCVKRAMNCYSMVSCLAGDDEAGDCKPWISFALGVAGDSYMGCVYNWETVPVYHEQYNWSLTAEAGIAKEIEKYTSELDRDWIIKQPKDIREAMELAIKCYTRALELVDNSDVNLIRRLANVENELGVFFMNQAAALLDQVSADQGQVSVTAVAGARDLFNFSRKYLHQGSAKFESINDVSNIALLLSNTGRLSRLAAHMVSVHVSEGNTNNSSDSQEFSAEEAGHYKAAVDYYQQALTVLGSKKEHPGIWDTVQWELCSTLFTMGTLYQDQAPLSQYSRDKVEKIVTDLMSQSLRYCDQDNGSSPRQQMYQARAGMIHHRLASLYHHSYRATLQSSSDVVVDNQLGNRNKKLKQLSELHYVKATTIFTNLCMFSQAIRAILERAGLMEAFLASSKTDSAKYKVLLLILDIILEAENVIKKIVGREDDDEVNKEELDQEKKMMETVLQRLQFTLLSMIKASSGSNNAKNKRKSEKKTSDNTIVKDAYAATLKYSSENSNFSRDLLELIEIILKDRSNM